VIVALRALGLGDLLTAVPALRALARRYHGHELVLAAPAWQAPLVALAGGGWRVLDTAALEPLHWAGAGPDVAVNLHGRGPQSTAVLRALGPGRLVAFGEDGGPTWRGDEHEVARWCRLLEGAGIGADASDLRLDGSVLPPSPAPGATVLHPGAASGSRRWPAERWAAVARTGAGRGRRVVVTGSGAELELTASVVAGAGLDPGDSLLAGRTDSLELASLVASAGLVLCGDTGVAHLASAFGTPSVVLFGPTSPSRWGPPPGGPHHVLWHGREDQPGDPHGAEPDPALLAITVDEVVTAADRLHGARARA
jgi:ADP-heptose:LPS heptosyltransferase